MKPTQEQVIAWAREAGFEPTTWQLSFGYEACGTHEAFERLAALAYEAGSMDEREWQGLTNDEIMDACSAVWASHPIEVGQVVAAILKEKNGF